MKSYTQRFLGTTYATENEDDMDKTRDMKGADHKYRILFGEADGKRSLEETYA
jgi:hypothetical protein